MRGVFTKHMDTAMSHTLPQCHIRIRIHSENPGGCVTRLRTLVLIGCCSSSIEINYHNKCYIMFFKLYVLSLFSITKLVVLLNWPVFLDSTIFGGQVD